MMDNLLLEIMHFFKSHLIDQSIIDFFLADFLQEEEETTYLNNEFDFMSLFSENITKKNVFTSLGFLFERMYGFRRQKPFSFLQEKSKKKVSLQFKKVQGKFCYWKILLFGIPFLYFLSTLIFEKKE
jgi:hypothetical protein